MSNKTKYVHSLRIKNDLVEHHPYKYQTVFENGALIPLGSEIGRAYASLKQINDIYDPEIHNIVIMKVADRFNVYLAPFNKDRIPVVEFTKEENDVFVSIRHHFKNPTLTNRVDTAQALIGETVEPDSVIYVGDSDCTKRFILDEAGQWPAEGTDSRIRYNKPYMCGPVRRAKDGSWGLPKGCSKREKEIDVQQKEPLFPTDARDFEVFAIKPGSDGEKQAFIGFKDSHGDFHFRQIRYTGSSVI